MRLDTIVRCFQTIEALKSHGGITADELSEKLGVSRRTAYRYIDSASVALRIIEHPERPARFELQKDMAHFDTDDGIFRPPSGKDGRYFNRTVNKHIFTI